MWLTERGGRISPRQVDDRSALWRTARSAAGVVGALFTPLLCLNLIENGVDPLFVQQQVGAWASTAAVYTQVGAEAKNRMLRAAFHEPWTQADGRIYIKVPQWSVTMFRLL